MIKPFKGEFRLTQGWGENPDVYQRFGYKGHNGTDWGLPTGTEVIAPHGGKVIEVANDQAGYGNYIKIENDKEGSILAHLKEFKVKLNDTVTEGQLVAISNNTGFSTGPHLHWGFYLKPRDRNNGYGGTIDSIPLIKSSTTDYELLYEDCRVNRDNHWNDLVASKETIKNLNHQISEKNELIKQKEIQLSTQATEVTELEKQIERLATQNKKIPHLEKELDQALNDRRLALEAQENQNKKYAQLERRYNELQNNAPALFVEYIVTKLKWR